MTKYEDPKKYLRNKIITDIRAVVDEIDCIAIKAIYNGDEIESIEGLVSMKLKLASALKAIMQMDELSTFASKFHTMKAMHEVRDRVHTEAVKPYIGLNTRASINNTILTMMELFDCI